MSAPTSDEAAIRQTIRALREAGCKLVSVDIGEGRVTVSTEAEAISEATAADAARLHVDLSDGSHGWVFFVLGNDPEEVICNHTINLSDVLDPLTEGWWAW